MKRFTSGGEELELDSHNLAYIFMPTSQNRNNNDSNNSNNNNGFTIFEQPNQLLLSSSTSFKIFERRTRRHNRRFECKTCNRQFSSFQALGGHRASHKKPRLQTDHCVRASHVGPAKPKIHECPICGLQFSIGQALGGHMRRHRTIGNEINKSIEEKQIKEDKLFIAKKQIEEEKLFIAKKQIEEEKLCLDLNLAPPGGQNGKKSNEERMGSIRFSSKVD